jgi:hypothetical protein
MNTSSYFKNSKCMKITKRRVSLDVHLKVNCQEFSVVKKSYYIDDMNLKVNIVTIILWMLSMKS